MPDCYYQSQGKIVGPVAPGQLQQLAAQGAIDGETLVRKGTEGPWVPAKRVKGLIAARPVSAQPARAAAVEQPAQSPVAASAGPGSAFTRGPDASRAAGPARVLPFNRTLAIAAVLLGALGLASLVAVWLLVIRPTLNRWSEAQSQLKQLQSQLSVTKPAPQPASEPPSAEPADSKSQEPEWIDASEGSARQKTIEVGIASASVGKVQVDSLLVQQPMTVQRCLQITVRVRNHSKTKKLEYATWSGANALAAGVNSLLGQSSVSADTETARLTDNFGNRYRLVDFGLGTQVSGQHAADSVYPGKSITDLLLFEIPVDNFKYLNLELPASKTGGDGVFRLRIPRSMVKGM